MSDKKKTYRVTVSVTGKWTAVWEFKVESAAAARAAFDDGKQGLLVKDGIDTAEVHDETVLRVEEVRNENEEVGNGA